MVILSPNIVNGPFNKVRQELYDIGLLRYLDKTDLYIAVLPSFGELGYVYDKGVPWLRKLAGFKPGVIYMPSVIYVSKRQISDVIRHEYAHSWRWIDPAFMRKPWFRKAFGGRYEDGWKKKQAYDPDEFVSNYATTRPAENFAETFMTFLKYRKTLGRFRKRTGVYRKLMAVKKAVGVAAKERV